MDGYRVLMDGEEIAANVRIADSFIKRFKGLLFVDGISQDEGLLISPCNQVHTLGMKFDIDVVFLSKSGEILHTEENMSPGIVGPSIRKCHQVLELKAGVIEKKKIANGRKIAFDPIYRI